mmetsp:Transcript_107620/g.185548  ORF Transcript_107620/g.185548 Transcript_107620/m.185548 type:complete len:169 (-) Transcript_107620:32-538(-)
MNGSPADDVIKFHYPHHPQELGDDTEQEKSDVDDTSCHQHASLEAGLDMTAAQPSWASQVSGSEEDPELSNTINDISSIHSEDDNQSDPDIFLLHTDFCMDAEPDLVGPQQWSYVTDGAEVFTIKLPKRLRPAVVPVGTAGYFWAIQMTGKGKTIWLPKHDKRIQQVR